MASGSKTMALKPISDPNLLAQLETAPAAPSAARKPVTDPALLAQLEGAPPAASVPPPTAPNNASPSNILQDIVDLPGVGTAVNATTGAVNLGVKALSGVAGLFGADPKAIQDKLSVPYTPTADPIQAALGGVHKAIEESAPVQAAGNAIENASPGVRTAAEAAIEAVPDVAGVLGAKMPLEGAVKAAAPVQGAAKAAAAGDPVATLRAAGYKFRPSDVQAVRPGEKVPGVRRESLQDPAELKKDFTLENQATTTKLAAEDLGVTDKKALMEKDYAELKKPHFDTYTVTGEAAGKFAPSEGFRRYVENAAGDKDFPSTTLKTLNEFGGSIDGPTAIKKISELRNEALRDARSGDKATRNAGERTLEAANRLEDEIAAQLKSGPEPGQYDDFVKARTALAKINDYERSTRGGQVDAQALRRIDKRNPGRMTGNAKLIADSADYAKNVSRHSQGATGVRSSVKPDSIVGAVRKGAGKLISKIPGMDVTTPEFQSANYGREATPAERASFKDYGKRPERAAPPAKAAPRPGTEGVDFTLSPGVPPVRSLASELELAPEPVANPQQLPDVPDFMTADTPPPVRGDIDFTASPDVGLAGELGLADYAPSQHFPNGPIDAPTLSLLTDLAEQLGLRVDTPQPVPPRSLEPPPGRVGKPKAKK